MHLSPDLRSWPVRAPLLRARLIVPLLLVVLVGAVALVAIPLLHGRASTSVSTTGSAPSLPEGAVQSLSTPGTTTYLGAIPGTRAFLGLVRTGQRARAYVCDGRPGQHPSLSDWFAEPVSGGSVQAKSSQGDQLSVQLSAQSASGTLTLAGGRAFSFTVPVVTNAGQAGVFEGTERVQGQLVHVGWLVLPNGDQRGSSGGRLFRVTSTLDRSGICPSPADCTLRQALNLAASGDTISFYVRGTIVLTTRTPLAINTNHVTIAGPGTGGLVISGNQQTAVFFLNHVTGVEIADLTIRDGSADNAAPDAGGGIFNAGDLTLLRSILSQNSARNGGGGLVNAGSLIMRDCTVTDNRTDGNGGGILNTGTAKIFTSTISHNSASNGGGISNEGIADIETSTISHNSASSGGGISNEGDADISNDTVSSNVARNTASGGGGLENEGTADIEASTFVYNSASTGAGLRSSESVKVRNSTFFGNTATNAGGAIALFPHQFGQDIIQNSTIAGNTAADHFGSGGILFEGLPSAGQQYFLGSSIVANNTAFNGGANPDILGAFTSLGHNLVGQAGSGSSGYVSSDQRGSIAHPLNPQLGALANNGGPTRTLALLPSSPAIDPGDCQLGAPATATYVDQRGVRRQSPCDVGAFETVEKR